MKNERLLQYIASLSDEEREKYRDLIEEALQINKMLAETLSAMKTCIEDLAENLRRFREELDICRRVSRSLTISS
jgi:septation ring formation regulator EzrA